VINDIINNLLIKVIELIQYYLNIRIVNELI